MNWKKWPYWLRGGVILFILGIILNIIGWIAELKNVSPVTKGLGYAVVNLPVLFIVTLVSRILKPLGLPLGLFFSNIMVLLIIYFLIGALIGWIIGKIKSKSK